MRDAKIGPPSQETWLRCVVGEKASLSRQLNYEGLKEAVTCTGIYFPAYNTAPL
jgi:hypothetical protein